MIKLHTHAVFRENICDIFVKIHDFPQFSQILENISTKEGTVCMPLSKIGATNHKHQVGL